MVHDVRGAGMVHDVVCGTGMRHNDMSGFGMVHNYVICGTYMGMMI